MSIKAAIANDPKIATTVAAVTTISGISGIFDWLPHDLLAHVATLVGIVLSCVLIYTHWRRGRIDYERMRYDLQLKREAEARRKRDAALQRRREGDKDQPA